jgi:DinB family protein
MKQKIDEFELLLNKLETLLSTNPIADFEAKRTEDSWSKKEILGHLTDSAINNLQRFTEIQYSEKPYHIRPYQQAELVKANDYQNKSNKDLFNLLIALNRHIIYLIKNQTDESLKYQVVLPNQATTDLKFVIEDYIGHFHHHLNQLDIKK